MHRTDVALEGARRHIEAFGEAFPDLGGRSASVGDDEDVAVFDRVVLQNFLNTVKEGGGFPATGATEKADQFTVRCTHCSTYMCPAVINDMASGEPPKQTTIGYACLGIRSKPTETSGQGESLLIGEPATDGTARRRAVVERTAVRTLLLVVRLVPTRWLGLVTVRRQELVEHLVVCRLCR